MNLPEPELCCQCERDTLREVWNTGETEPYMLVCSECGWKWYR